MSLVTTFVGPSACELHGLADDAGVECRPPASRGDIDRLIEERPVGVIVLCDGVFQSKPAVAHAELCRAIDAGWQVWGVSSMGAIRAHELRFEGMRGFGYVYRQFSRFHDFTDDEVCLLHFPEPPYFPVSEALVNVRYALERKGAALGLSSIERQRVIRRLRRSWFGDRIEARVRECLVVEAAVTQTRVDEFCAWLRCNRIKNIDFADLMAEQPWRSCSD